MGLGPAAGNLHNHHLAVVILTMQATIPQTSRNGYPAPPVPRLRSCCLRHSRPTATPCRKSPGSMNLAVKRRMQEKKQRA